MKRFICILMTVAMLLTLAGCAKVEVAEGEATDWQAQYDLGVRYLSDGNYEEAILAFKAAIEIDPKQENAYLKCAEAYVLQGDNDSALEVLEQGYRETHSELLLQEKNKIEGSIQENSQESSQESPVVTEEPTGPLAYTVERTDRSVQNNNGGTVLKLYYDLVTIEGNSAVAEQINAALRSEHDSFFSSSDVTGFIGDGADAFIENNPMATADFPFIDTVEAVVTYNDGKYFSVELKSEWYGGGVFNMGYSGSVFDAETGAQIGLDELVPDSLTRFADIIWNFYSKLDPNVSTNCTDAYDYLYSQLTYDDLNYCLSSTGEITVLTKEYDFGFPGYIGAQEIPTGMYIEQATQNIATEEEFVQAILGQWRRYDDEQDATFFVYFGEDGTAAIAIGYGTAGCFAGGSGTWKLESFSGDGKGSVYIEILWKSDDGGTQNWDKGTIEITADGISPRLNSVDEGIPLVTGRYSSYPWYYVE